MGAKWKSKTHLQNTFFDFLSRFLRVRLQSLQKVQIWPKKIFLCKKSENTSKNSEFHADFESIEKVVKKCAKKKVLAKKFWRTWVKNEKRAFFPHIFANNFFMVHFFKTFSTGLKSAWYPYWILKRNFVLLLLALFVNFDCKCERNGSKKRKIFFYECVLEFY